MVELLDLVGARAPDRLLQSVGERSRPGRAFGVSPVMPALRGPFPSSAGTSPVAGAARARWRVGLADDAPVLAGRVVEPVELPVGDPDGARVQALERPEVLLTEHDQPQPSQCSQVGGVDDPVLSPCEQVDGGPGGEVPRQRSAGRREREHLRGEGRQDHVSDGRPQRPADEPATQQVGRELPYAVGLHPRLLEQPAVDRELPLDRIRGLGEGDVVLDRPALGVPGVHRLVQRYAEAAQDRPLRVAGRRRSGRACRAASRSRGRRCGSGSRCARGQTARGRSAPTPGTGAEGSPSSGPRGPGRRGRASRVARRHGAAAARTPPAPTGGRGAHDVTARG